MTHATEFTENRWPAHEEKSPNTRMFFWLPRICMVGLWLRAHAVIGLPGGGLWLMMKNAVVVARFCGSVGRDFMNRFVCCVTTLGLGWGVITLSTAVAYGQAAPAETRPAPGTAAASGVSEASAPVRDLADRVRELGDAIAADLSKASSGPVLLRDARELGLTVDEFYQALTGAPDSMRRRQLYSGVDSGWHHLRTQLSRAGASSPRVDAAAKQVAEADAQVHRVLGLNPYPAVYYGDRASPGGMPEMQRLARALVDRSEALLAAVRADQRGPSGSRLAEDVTSLVRAADTFHDGINLESRPDDLMRNAFAGVSVASDAVAGDLATVQASDRVRAAWQSYRTVELLLRQALKLPVRQAELRASAVPVEGRTPVLALADRLIEQVDEFLIVFTPEARFVQEGGYFIADARRLRGAAAEFRAEIPRAIDVGQLAYAFRDVDALWQVLARRTNRIAAGGPGANVERIQGIGLTVAEIHQLLGMPGIPAVVGTSGR
jgi:hypothetical protein